MHITPKLPDTGLDFVDFTDLLAGAHVFVMVEVSPCHDVPMRYGHIVTGDEEPDIHAWKCPVCGAVYDEGLQLRGYS